MKKFLSVLLVLAAVFMVSCSNGSEGDSSIDLDGTWYGYIDYSGTEKLETKFVINDSVATFYFTNDEGSNWEKSLDGVSVTVNGNKIVFSDGADTLEGTLADDGKTFTVQGYDYTTGTVIVFTYKKQ